MNTKTCGAGVLIGLLGITAVAVAQRATAPDPGALVVSLEPWGLGVPTAVTQGARACLKLWLGSESERVDMVD